MLIEAATRVGLVYAIALGLLAALIHLPIREEPGPLALAEAET